MFSLNNIPPWSIHTKPDRGGLFAFFKKPWDGLQTTVRVTTDLDYTAANNKAPQAIVDFLNSKNPVSAQVIRVSRTSLTAMLPEFVKDKMTHLRRSTVDGYKGDIQRLIRTLGDTAEDIAWEAIRDYFAGMIASGRANKGHDNELVNIRAFWNYLRDDRKLFHLDNYPSKIRKLGNYGRRDVIWYRDEYDTYYNEATPGDKCIMQTFWNTGIYPADYFFTRKKHIIPFEGDWVYQKLRQKANSPKAIINLPLKYCPARDMFMEAFERAKNPEDKIFVPEWNDKQYDTWSHTLNQRGRRLWEKLFPDRVRKIYPDMRHTFATECANGSRFGRMIPEWQLEQWMGWVPGSQMGAKFYFSAKSIPELMKPYDHLAMTMPSSSPVPMTNFHERLPFT